MGLLLTSLGPLRSISQFPIPSDMIENLPKRTPNHIYGSVRQQDIFFKTTAKWVPCSLERSSGVMVFSFPKASVPDWDVLGNKFYKAFYTLRPIHLDPRVRYEGFDN